MRDEYFASAQPIDDHRVINLGKSDLTVGRVVLHAALLGLTVVSTFLTGAFLAPSSEQIIQATNTGSGGLAGWWGSILSISHNPQLASCGLAYSFTLISILLAHEMGHYLACRYYGIRASLPYFIPAPTFIGTFGAFIRIKQPITSRRALFDIGIAGPLAGFAVAIPAALIGMLIAEPAQPLAPTGSSIVFKDPLFFIIIQQLFNVPTMIEWNPIYFAAWVGMLATSLNLLPVGQLDGGHVAYALLGRRGHRLVAQGVFAVICVLAVVAYSRHRWPGWFIYAGLLGLLLGLKHPPVADEHQPMDRLRLMVGVIGLVVFILSFMPIPIAVE